VQAEGLAHSRILRGEVLNCALQDEAQLKT
jgi:hypothetical protein